MCVVRARKGSGPATSSLESVLRGVSVIAGLPLFASARQMGRTHMERIPAKIISQVLSYMRLNAEKGPQRLLRTLRHPISHGPIHQVVLGSASNPIV